MNMQVKPLQAIITAGLIAAATYTFGRDVAPLIAGVGVGMGLDWLFSKKEGT